MDNKTIKHLKELEAESIYVLREVAAQFERPVILFSGGKDSIVITYLAYKAFYPAKIPFPLLHMTRDITSRKPSSIVMNWRRNSEPNSSWAACRKASTRDE